MTDTVKPSDKRRMLADFDCYNKDILLQILYTNLQKGYMLCSLKGFIGLLTFERAPEAANVTYAVIQTALYSNGGKLVSPWEKCGNIGDYTVYRSMSEAKIPKPDKDPAEVESSNKSLNIFISLMWFFQLTVRLFIPDKSASDAFLIILLMINTAGYMYKALNPVDRQNTRRGLLVYFWRYILVYGIILFLVIPFCLWLFCGTLLSFH